MQHIAQYIALPIKPMRKTDNNNDTVVRSFIGKQAEDLGNLICVQIKPVYESLGISVPVKSCSIIHFLNQFGQASLADLAKSLQQSHQLVKQKIPRLLKLGFITAEQDQDDKRRTLYSLTKEGVEQAQLLNKHSFADVYENLSREVNADLYEILSAAIKGLKQKDLLTRFYEQKKEN